MTVFAAFPDLFLAKIDWIMGGWGHQWTNGEILSFAIGFGLLKFLEVLLLLLWDPLRFALTPGPVKSARVHDAAIKHFNVGAERSTHGRTRVLIYLSMRETRAEIVADEAIAVNVPAEV